MAPKEGKGAARAEASATSPRISILSSPSWSSRIGTRRSLARLRPLTLATPELVKLHTPTTLRTGVLPSELACRLFYYMAGDAKFWPRNTYYLFDKLVTSPHRTTFFVRSLQEGRGNSADMTSYNGKVVHEPKEFPWLLEEACRVIEPIVLEEMQKRRRYPLEWGGHPAWTASVAAVNCYEGMKEGVGYHADALTYLGPHCTIASLSLGCERRFRLRETLSPDPVREPRTFDIPLPHNSLLIMHPLTQERFKHSIPPQTRLDVFRPPLPALPGGDTRAYNQRINITFRFYRPDFCDLAPNCACGLPAILRPDLKGKYAGRMDPDDEYQYFWQCDAGKVNEGKGCGLWQLMDWKAEKRGPMLCEETRTCRNDAPC
ncbi:hypothetical protein CALCODRAFT_435763 [Calocera cornea HHB12733]|uniref:Fe2OG dioxygenase domain-containing protein n=1 Tax=Calocera cornea HHB12733 TaxID=1353952 RepID=A0A165F9F6_9BASI|nr:hypothetical protein CALCODRAFT_435763 [Calocera cornea HHB12733]